MGQEAYLPVVGRRDDEMLSSGSCRGVRLVAVTTRTYEDVSVRGTLLLYEQYELSLSAIYVQETVRKMQRVI